jgi:hypothetical protein
MYYKFPLNLFLPNWADLNEKQMMFWCCIKYFSYTVSYGDGSHFGFQINRLKINFSRVHPKIILGNSEAMYACCFTEIKKNLLPTCVLLFDMFEGIV